MLSNIFKKKEEYIPKETKIEQVCTDEYSKILMLKNLENINITLKDLFNITQEAKKTLDYSLLDNSDKYLIERYQDMILFIARDYRNLDKILSSYKQED